MTAPQWQRAKTVLQAALDVPPEARAAFVRDACGGDRDLQLEVEALLAAHSEAASFLSGPAAELTVAASLAGRRVGPYRILDEIGRGGMGVVHRAVRDDDVFRKTVAFKLVPGGASPLLLAQFTRERRILGRLQHPNIAAILDGGTTEEGQPYLVMEHVEGEPITRYCEERSLGARERLRLFQTVCATVHHAHQNLVVHRDLKPANVLVTAEGQPKLLDFGIAKLLAAGVDQDEAPTATLLPMMTPAYASPEQVRGEAVTTASDVYSLGLLLYELLTGKLPYEVRGESLPEVVRSVCDTEPRPPSAAVVGEAARAGSTVTAADLRGDLDTIVLKTLRKEPARRYLSAQELSDDIGRHLDGHPVRARADRVGYRLAKFAGRHRTGVVAAFLVAVSVLLGLAMTLRQARIAEANRERAERRFSDVRKLANSFLFEFHDAIETLPGSTPARELVVKRAVLYLDSLAQEAAGDPSLQAELAQAYLRLGDLQGRPNYAHLGDFGAARASYEKSVELARSAAAARPDDRGSRQNLAVALNSLGLLESRMNDIRSAERRAQEALRVQETVLAEAPGEVDALRVSLTITSALGAAQVKRGERARALATHQEALPRYEAVAAATGSLRDRFNVFVAHARVGDDLKALGRPAEALQSYESMRRTVQALLDENPADTDLRRSLAVGLNKLGDLLRETGDLERALARYREALGLREALVAADARNALAGADLVGSYVRIGDLLVRRGERAAAAAEFRRAAAILERIAARDPKDKGAAADVAGVVARLAPLEVEGDPSGALARHRAALAALEAVARADADNLGARYDVAAALTSLARAETTVARRSGPASLARSACDRYAEARDLWRDLVEHPVEGERLDNGPPRDQLEAVLAALAECGAG